MSRCLPLLLLAACQWIDDEADRERRDSDGDGLSLHDDCNDDDAAIGELPAPDAALACDEVVSASVSGADRLFASTCLHPLRHGEELLLYGPQEDLWSLDLPTDGLVEVRLVPAPGFTQDGPGRDGEPTDIEVAGVVLWAWPEGRCPRESCHLGAPLTDPETGTLAGRGEPVVRFEGRAGERWIIVVSAKSGSGYDLVVECS